ncbi:glycosyltransferase family 4 protein [Spirosoma jeollabukense]
MVKTAIHNTLIFKHVLHIGPNYKDHKGGMGAVVDVYQKNITNFKFLASYEGNYSSLTNIPFFIIAFVKYLRLLIIDKDIKVIHMHGASYGSFYRKFLFFAAAKYFFSKKVVYHLHAAEFHVFYKNSDFLSKKMIASLINNSDSIVVLSTRWSNYVKETFNPKYILVVNNPIEMPGNNFTYSADNQVKLLFMGRIGQRKGLFDLLDVLTENHDRYVNRLSLQIGGDGEVDKLKSYIQSNNLNDSVNYIGWANGDLKHRALSDCDVLILPSYNEGLPIAILEAMSYGKAIIATNVGGIPEVVKEGSNGFLIEPGDKLALKRNIDSILDDRSRLSKMGEKSLGLIRNYDINEVVKSLTTLYERILH